MAADNSKSVWVRKASETEVEMDKEHLKGHMMIWYQLDLSSKEPLKEEHVKAALEHLYRKASNLKVCFGIRDGENWFRKATNPDVDFKVHHGVSLEEVRRSLRSYRYSSNTGPLFCSRLMFNPPDLNEGFVDLDPSFPYKSHVMFGLHHAMTDGTSNMFVMGFFISLLNDVIANKPIDDEESLGTFPSDEESQRVIIEKKEQLEKDTDLQQKIENDLKLMKNEVLVDKAFQKFEGQPETASIVKILDPTSTMKFIQRCRQEKVTVTSVLTAIVNMAYMDIAIQEGFVEDVYTVTNAHIVSLRRYWKTDVFQTLGLHMDYPLTYFTETPRDVRSNFWSYAKKFGDNFKDDVISGRLLANKAHALLSSERGTKDENNSHSSKGQLCDFGTSCMGDITSKVTEGGDHVKITNVIRGTSFHFIPYPALFNCHTFRNVFTIIFEHNTTAIPSAIGERLAKQIVQNIQELIQ